jgi:hypothetical protein
MADPLHSARTKLERANNHARVARSEARRFFNRHPDPTFRVYPEGDKPLVIGSIHPCRLVLTSDTPELPVSFSARFGDAIYNYRCVLDHISWQLVRHGASWPLKDDRAENLVQFPIYDRLVSFDKNFSRRLPGVSKTATDYIRGRHKYARGKATNKALLGLARLVNDDKHRELLFFLSLFKSLEANVEFIRCLPVTWDNPTRRPALKNGAVVTRFSVEITGQDPKMKMNLRPEAQIVDKHGRDFSEMLEGIRGEVTEILNAPEILAAVS